MWTSSSARSPSCTYPASSRCPAEFARVLRPGGDLVISDVHHDLVTRGSAISPRPNSRARSGGGTRIARHWARAAQYRPDPAASRAPGERSYCVRSPLTGQSNAYPHNVRLAKAQREANDDFAAAQQCPAEPARVPASPATAVGEPRLGRRAPAVT
jgi:hypothetical protein